MRVWMLTGDKGLTAKSIGVSCGLLSNATKDGENTLFQMKDELTPAEIEEEMKQIIAKATAINSV